MLFRQMKYFVSIVDCNSFTEAAEQNYISQSAISQQMKSLEDELGVQLLVREGRKVKMTPAGEYFYRHALAILEDVDQVTKETIQIGKYDDQHMLIGFLKNYGGQVIQRTMMEFNNLYPEVAIDIINGNHEELYDLLRFGEADLVLNDQRRAFSDQYINYELTSSPCYVEICKTNKLSQLTYLTMDDLKRISCIVIADKGQEETEKEYYKNTLGFKGDFIVAGNLESARIMVSANKGFLPVSGSHFNRYDPIVRIPLYEDGKQIRRKYCLFWKKEKGGYYVEEFAAMLRKNFNEAQEL